MEDIKFLEEAIERNSQITVATFQSAYEKEKREVFQKQFLPHVQHLRLCATHWEQELQKEVKSMMEIFQATENTISKEKRRNKVLQKQSDRLLEFVLNADILSVIMNALYESGTSSLVDDHKTENELLKDEIVKLKYENEDL